MSGFAEALGIANAVLYEGYLLYPYTASSPKNRVRWQFGVVVPRAYALAGTGEPCEQQTEVLIEADDPALNVRLRFLHVEARRVEAWIGGAFVPVDVLTVAGTQHVTFDEAIEREVVATVEPVLGSTQVVPIAFAAGIEHEPLHDPDGALRGRIVRERWPVVGALRLSTEAVDGHAGLVKLRVLVANESVVVPGESRDSALRTALVSTHILLRVEGGRVLSLLDPPGYAKAATERLENRHVFPVLVGEQAGDEHGAALAFSSPIILYDFPAVAPQTKADAFDGTEIEELLALSVLSLSDAERAEARATDPRARAIVDRAEAFGALEVERLHRGALTRSGSEAYGGDPFAALDVPALDCVFVGEHKVRKGAKVRLHPRRRADVWDTFLDGKDATVRAIHQDLEDQFYVAVTVDDDPATELHEWYGRSFFFYPEEIEVVAAGGAPG